jgi:prevent-host-death family protein
MRSVGISQLRDRLGEYVRLAAAGEIVVVTDRDRPVARLSPVTDIEHQHAGDPLAELVRQGIATPATAAPGTVPPSFGLVEHDRLMRDLEADRADR